MRCVVLDSRAALAAVLVLALCACGAIPRADVTAEEDVALATGLTVAVEFRQVGADGGPLDEPADEPGGEPGATEDALALAAAIERAVTTDPGLQAALARVRGAAAQADQARTLPNPVLGVAWLAGSGAPRFEASFTQDFVRVLQRPARASAADQRLRAAAAEAVVAALDVVREVHEAYIAVQASAELLPLLTERLALVDRLVATARARLEAGEGTRGDVVTLDAQRVELLVAIDRARLEARTQRLRLARRIGAPSSDAQWVLEPRAPLAPPTLQPADWIRSALEARPELQAARWRLRALGDETEVAARAAWEEAAAGLAFESDDGERLGAALSTPLPLFDDGQARRDELAAEVHEARHELTRVARRVVEEVRTAHETYAASLAALARVERELIPLERQRRQLAEDAYRAGQTDVTALFLAEQDLRIAETQAIELQARAATALVHLQRAVGGAGVARRLADGVEAAPAQPEQP